MVTLLMLTGCEARTLGFVDYAGDVMKATGNGIATGGPIGGIIGLVTGLCTAHVGNRRREGKIDRRDSVIETYRAKHGNLSAEEYQQATTKQKKKQP